jgi:hypothetical protein
MLKIIIWWLCILITGFLLLTAIYPRLLLCYLISTRYSKVNTPWAYCIPQKVDLLKNSNGTENTQKIKFKKIVLELPRQEIEDRKELEKGLLLSYRIGSLQRGLYLVAHDNLIISFKELASEQGISTESMLLQKGVVETYQPNYSLYELALNASPSDLHYFASFERMNKLFLELLFKRVISKNETYILCFNTEKIKGFQFGDPEKKKGVEVEFFNQADDLYAITFYNHTQNEINQILVLIQ